MREKILKILRGGGYVSGEKISEMLSISRNAVWKHIRKLRQEGYNIISAKSKGYMLASCDILNAEEILSRVNTRFVARNVVYFPVVDSTNDLAKRECSMPDGTLFIAGEQTGGRGRLGRSWQSEADGGIWMSVLLKPDVNPSAVSQITLIAGLAVCRAIGMGAGIKYPNDVVIGTKKVCGILTELSAEINAVNYVVCGIGINVNTESFCGELENKATSLFMEDGRKRCRAEIVCRVAEELESLYTDFLEHGLENIIGEYREKCVNIGKTVCVTLRRETRTGTCLDIDENGSIIVEIDNKPTAISSGEVSVRGMLGYV